MVRLLIERLPKQRALAECNREMASYEIYTVNYFTSVALLSQLRQLGVGACGTVRTIQVPHLFQELRDGGTSRHIPVHYRCSMSQYNVPCFMWKGSNAVLTLSTIHSPNNLVNRPRKRPVLSSTNGQQFQDVFGDNPVLHMNIPELIGDYNHEMKSVDRANQYRANYETHQTSLEIDFQSYFGCLIMLSSMLFLVYRVHQSSLGSFCPFTHIQFRQKIYQELFESNAKLPHQRLDKSIHHESGRIQNNGKWQCVWCSFARKVKRENGKPSRPHGFARRVMMRCYL